MPKSRWRASVAALTLPLVLLGLTQNAQAAPAPLLGVLIADQDNLRADYDAGVRMATLELKWGSWEPGNDVPDQAYRQQQRNKAEAYRAAGYRLAVDIGLQHPGPWVLALPDGQLVDQSGTVSGTPDFFHSQLVRDEAASYIRSVVATLGATTTYRIGLSPAGELMYPEAPRNQWWAFGRHAQGLAGGLPVGRTATPLPGWVPGTASWRGSAVTGQQARTWYDWYLSASVSAHQWEMSAFRRAGATSWLELVAPGSGANPWVYEHRLAGLLQDQPYDAYHTLNTGAVWQEVLQRLPARNKVAVDVSSVFDGSGTPRGNACAAGDGLVDYRGTPGIDAWSSTRWLSYLARRNGYPAVYGESTGNNLASDVPAVFALARACGLTVVQWAWDYQLHDGVHASLADLQRAAT